MASHIMAPLNQVLSGKPRKLKWDTDQQTAFTRAKRSIATAMTLAHPHPEGTLSITTDASDVAMGAVLQSHHNDSIRPLSFFSRKLQPAQQRYSTFDRELLAAHEAIRHFKHMVAGTSFILYTDHKPLVTAITKSPDTWSDRQQHHLSSIAEAGATVEYLPGHLNPVADALSRITIGNVQPGINYQQMAIDQKADEETKAYKDSISNLQWAEIDIKGATLLCDISTGRPRPLVPKASRKAVVDITHGLSHPSIKSTIKLVKEKFVWNRMARDIKEWVKGCQQCQKCKTHKHTKTPIEPIHVPARRFNHIHVDIVGPLPLSNQMRYLFTITDRTTRWLEATPMTDATTDSCVLALLYTWIARFGVPAHMTSDRGAQFTSSLWKGLSNLLGIQLHHTTAYHPQSNGLVERWHRSIKAALMTRCNSTDWAYQLPWVLLGLRIMPHDNSSTSSAEAVYGQPLVIPGEFLPPAQPDPQAELQAARWSAGNFTPEPIRWHNRAQYTYIPQGLQEASHVFIRQDQIRPTLSPPYQGPYQVIQHGDKTALVDVNGRNDWVSWDRLKPAYTVPEDVGNHTRSGRTITQPDRLQYT